MTTNRTNQTDSTAECYAARTGEGYWTCDTAGGCPDCRALAAELATDLEGGAA